MNGDPLERLREQTEDVRVSEATAEQWAAAVRAGAPRRQFEASLARAGRHAVAAALVVLVVLAWFERETAARVLEARAGRAFTAEVELGGLP